MVRVIAAGMPRRRTSPSKPAPTIAEAFMMVPVTVNNSCVFHIKMIILQAGGKKIV